MLLGVKKLGWDILSRLAAMSAGEEVLITDGYFPGDGDDESKIVSGAGFGITELIDGIAGTIPIDQAMIMDVVPGDPVGHSAELVATMEARLRENGCEAALPLNKAERFACYARRPTVITCQQVVQYGNIWLRRAEGPLKGIAECLTPAVIKTLDRMGHGQTVGFFAVDCPLKLNACNSIEISGAEVFEAILPLLAVDQPQFSTAAAFLPRGVDTSVLAERVVRCWGDDASWQGFAEPIAEVDDIDQRLADPTVHRLSVFTDLPGEGCILIAKGLTAGVELKA